MEGGRKNMGSSSSFTSELFGSKESSGNGSSSAEIFGSLFAPSSKVAGREYICSKVGGKRPDSASHVCREKPGVSDSNPWSNEGKNQSTPSKDIGPFYQEEKVQPCNLSSSIYYGGQDIYNQPQSTQNSGYSTVKKDGGEDDSGSASRGNWWQGSFYY